MKLQVRLIWHSSKAWQAFKWALVGLQVRPCWRFPAWGIFKVGVSRNSEWWGLSRELMTLMKYHTEAGSERRWKPYNGGTAGAWSNGGYYAVGLLYHSLFRKNLKWTQVPRLSLRREGIAEGRLSVAMRELWEAGSRPRVCRAGDVLSRPLSVGKAARQVSSPMAIRNGHGKSCGGDGERTLCDLCENLSPSVNHGWQPMECDLCESFFHPETMVDNQWIATSVKAPLHEVLGKCNLLIIKYMVLRPIDLCRGFKLWFRHLIWIFAEVSSSLAPCQAGGRASCQ